MSAGLPSHSEDQLTEHERRELAEALAELRRAVADYGRFAAAEPSNDGLELRTARERVESAEERLWQLRGELLGWGRPPWAPTASLVSDWFSEEDSVYDEVTDATAS